MNSKDTPFEVQWPAMKSSDHTRYFFLIQPFFLTSFVNKKIESSKAVQNMFAERLDVTLW